MRRPAFLCLALGLLVPLAAPAEDPKDELRKRAYDARPAGNALLAAMEIGLVTFDLSTPDAPARLGELEVPGSAVTVATRGTQAWVCAGPVGLIVADVSDLRRPRTLGTLDTPGAVLGVAFQDDVAYLADGTLGTAVVDAADVAHLREVARLDTGDTVRDVLVAGTVLWTAEGLDGVRAWDLADPRHPRALGTVALPGGDARRLAAAGDRVFVAAGAAGLAVLRVEGGRPRLSGTARTRDLARGVAPLGDHLVVVADGTSGILILDVTDAAHPRTVGQARGPDGPANRVAVQGTRAFVAQDYSGIVVYDLADPASPRPATGK